MNGEENYEEIVDEAEDQYDDAQDVSEGQMDQFDGGTYSVPKEKSDLYNWFWRVVRLDEAHRLAKVGNLTKVEIGEHGITMRDAMNLANLGDIFHHKKFADYWRNRAITTSTTSMAKDGWFMDLSISQKKVRQRAKTSSAPFEKSRIFGRKRQDNNKGDQ